MLKPQGSILLLLLDILYKLKKTLEKKKKKKKKKKLRWRGTFRAGGFTQWPQPPVKETREGGRRWYITSKTLVDDDA
jgi:hypothetical protein